MKALDSTAYEPAEDMPHHCYSISLHSDGEEKYTVIKLGSTAYKSLVEQGNFGAKSHNSEYTPKC